MDAITSALFWKITAAVAAFAVLGVLVLGGLYLRERAVAADAEAARAAAQASATVALAANAANAETIEKLRADAASTAALVQQAQAREQAAYDRMSTFTRTLEGLKRNDAATKDWAARPLPDAVRGLLQGSPAGGGAVASSGSATAAH